jgi:hypothetical protein
MSKYHDFINSPDHTDAAKAKLILQTLCEFYSTQWLCSRHLAIILQQFQLGKYRNSLRFGTYRVDLVVTLYDRVYDPYNIELIFRYLSTEEIACIYCRIGWLNIFNPMKAEGYWQFDISRREERVIVKMLAQLAVFEPGENWPIKHFRWDLEKPGMPGWELVSVCMNSYVYEY